MKIKELQNYLIERNIDFALFLRKDPNLTYFTGFEDSLCLIVPKNKPTFIVVSSMEYLRAKESSKVKIIELPKNMKLFEFIKKIQKGKTIGINKNQITLNFFKAIKKQYKSKFVDISSVCSDLRKIKTEEEIEIYKKAYSLTDSIMQKTIKNFKNFKTEEEVAAFMQYEAKKKGCDLSFKTIVASGSNAAKPHHIPQGKIKKGFCIIDFGIIYKNYCTDITRTIFIGKPTKKQIEIYDKVLDIQEKIIKKIKTGQRVSNAYKMAFKELGNAFNHGLGHGIGVEIHELPNITEKSKEKFSENMIFTIEPGYYKGSNGIRIEDAVLLTKKGIFVLTKTPKKLFMVDYL